MASMSAGLPKSRIPTRLGDPTVTLRLACWDGGRLRPMCGEGKDPEHAWALSEVAVRASRVRGIPEATGALGRAIGAEVKCWTRYDEGKLLLPLGPSGPGRWTGTVLGRQGANVEVVYTVREGVQFAP